MNYLLMLILTVIVSIPIFANQKDQTLELFNFKNGTGGSPSQPVNAGTTHSSLAGVNCGLLSTCNFSGTITSTCNIANSDIIHCVYIVERTTGAAAGAKIWGSINATGDCTGTPTITIPPTACGTGTLGIGACVNCMQLRISCYNTISGLRLENDSTVSALFNCG